MEKMTEHEAILEIKDRLQLYKPENKDDLETAFYNNMTIDEIYDLVMDFNVLIGELHQILNQID